MVLWCCGVVVVWWCGGVVVLWCCGVVVLWKQCLRRYGNGYMLFEEKTNTILQRIFLRLNFL